MAGESAPRGLLRIGGARLARHQLALALSARCERIICVAREFRPELAELQREAEGAGASFHIVPGPRGMSGLITAADEVLVIVEGLLPTAGDALRLLNGPPAVFVQPAEVGVPAGFERIDLNHAAAGLMLVPGRLVDRLMDLPPDTDAASALLRIALQAGVQQRNVPEDVRLGGRWLLIRNEQEAQAAEDGWMVRHTAGSARTLGPLLSRFLVRRFGPALLHGGNSGLVGSGTAAILMAIGLALAWFGYAAPGLLLAGSGWVLRRAAGMLERLQRESLAQSTGPSWQDAAFDIVLDAVVVAILAVATLPLPGETLAQRGFAPVMLIGLLRLLPRQSPANLAPWLEDRLLLVALLALMIAGQVIQVGVPALAALLLLTGLVLPRDPLGRTSDELTRA